MTLREEIELTREKIQQQAAEGYTKQAAFAMLEVALIMIELHKGRRYDPGRTERD